MKQNHPNAHKITGVVCGVRGEKIKDEENPQSIVCGRKYLHRSDNFCLRYRYCH
ncbi:hypothetical protein [Sporolactobacillus sp. THM19-2]|uniref:hypothetical protein n=1 Tax=Sporolactobacillus sp. THM19-2 TaxID=2511171 RepID=UPI001021DE60|nr:hypothetical protein EWH91_12940 [Sporolactobacillus sp. THM19-2]